jgi:hypothetical protein
MRSIHALLAIILVLLASGCTTSTVTTGNGVVIESFDSGGITEVYPGEPITFHLKVMNTGSVEATNVFGELLGLDEDWATSSGPSSISGNKVLNGEILPRETSCQYTNAGSGNDLAPPDPIYGTEGQVTECTWMYKTPDIPQGMNPTYDITARLYYTYRTDLIESFSILSTAQLKEYIQQGRTVPANTASSTRSPVTITAESRSPIRFWSESGIDFPLAITVSNTGGGMACLEGRCKKASDGGNVWNKVVLKIEPMGDGLSLGDECSQYASGAEIEVWPNRDNTIICDIKVSQVSDIVGVQERMLKISAEYGYFIDAQSSIEVL